MNEKIKIKKVLLDGSQRSAYYCILYIDVYCAIFYLPKSQIITQLLQRECSELFQNDLKFKKLKILKKFYKALIKNLWLVINFETKKKTICFLVKEIFKIVTTSDIHFNYFKCKLLG